MLDVLLNKETHDFELSDSYDLQICSGATWLAQWLKQKLTVIQFEYFRNYLAGIKYYNDDNKGGNVFRKSPDVRIVESMYRATILEIEQVKEIKLFEIDYDTLNRQADLNLAVDSIEGLIELEISTGVIFNA